jgi:uncharacterized protein YdhG (YjbR/CyaY superfamily)
LSSKDVDNYLKGASPAQRKTLSEVRKLLLEICPAGEEVISYGMPAIKENGQVVAGYAYFKNHLSYFPHSSIVISNLETEIKNYKSSKGGFQFGNDEILPKTLLNKLVQEKRKLNNEKKSRV